MFRRSFLAIAAASAMTVSACSDMMMMSSTTMTSKDIVDTAVAADDFNTLVAAVQAAGLVDALKGPGPFTVFAPTDAAFAALPAGTVESLLRPENKDKLVNILTYHVLPGKVEAKDIAGKRLAVTMLNGSQAHVNAAHGLKIENANIVATDIQASNGVIHVIDAVIIPKN